MHRSYLNRNIENDCTIRNLFRVTEIILLKCFQIFETDSDTNTVFLVYDRAGNEQLGLTVGSDIALQYNDLEALEERLTKVKFNTSVNDGQ